MAVEADEKVIEKNESCQVSWHEELLIQVQIFHNNW